MDGIWALLQRRKSLVLLVALLLLIVVFPLFRRTLFEKLFLNGLVTAVFFGALLIFFVKRRNRLLALGLGAPMLAGFWFGYMVPGLPAMPLIVGFHLSAALFFSVTVAMLLWGIYSEDTVTADSIHAALCGYLLVGLAFSHVYCLVELAYPHSFRGNAEFETEFIDEGRRHYLLSYFSFVTLTTVGYGDIVAASEAARGLAVIEAVLGQFYLAVLMGELIGKRVAQAFSNR